MPCQQFFGLNQTRVWDIVSACERMRQLGAAVSKRTTERRLAEWGWWPAELGAVTLRDEQFEPPIPSVVESGVAEARRQRRLVLFAQLSDLPGGKPCLHANDSRGTRYWVPLAPQGATGDRIEGALRMLGKHIGKPVTLFPHGALTASVRGFHSRPAMQFFTLGYAPVREVATVARPALRRRRSKFDRYLDDLEAESIFILREAVAEADRPALLYSIGKDSSVMLHLARKAFFPAPLPFPLLHVDTRWKFREMYLMRDSVAAEPGVEFLVHVNPEAVAKNINPFDHGSALHTDITKTEGLKQALARFGIDLAFGGARRDEERSRAKERIFSFRTAAHLWDPKNQRPELWNLYNAKKRKGENIRVFPLSNWTELDVWRYIEREGIPVVPLYFARLRPVVVRDGLILMVDDARMRLAPGEKIELRTVRFRTLGCYPLSGAVESKATSVADIVDELLASEYSERQGRAIDKDTAGSMERKKREGYF